MHNKKKIKFKILIHQCECFQATKGQTPDPGSAGRPRLSGKHQGLTLAMRLIKAFSVSR